jgi:protocatechuate 3,4-dioxygenase beta subunit
MDNHDSDTFGRGLRRRELLIGLGALGVGGIWQASRGAGALARPAPVTASTAAVCVLSPEVTEGPYWILNHLTRRNITDNKRGLPLALQITVVNASTCKPIHLADVEIWHADVTGVYSGYSGNSSPSGAPGGHATPNNNKRFLRGHQKSDARGRVLFDTIYPGWYRGRTPHIHIKVHVGGNVVHTGQLFFADRTSDAVYRSGAYKAHGEPDTINAADIIYAQAGGHNAQVQIAKQPGHEGDRGQITVGVRT